MCGGCWIGLFCFFFFYENDGSSIDGVWLSSVCFSSSAESILSEGFYQEDLGKTFLVSLTAEAVTVPHGTGTVSKEEEALCCQNLLMSVICKSPLKDNRVSILSILLICF